jgi:hypothetical protein
VTNRVEFGFKAAVGFWRQSVTVVIGTSNSPRVKRWAAIPKADSTPRSVGATHEPVSAAAGGIAAQADELQ